MNVKQKNRNKFIGVVALAVIVGVISYPRVLGFWPKGEETLNKLKINLGLDLQGGIQLIYKVDLSQIERGKEAEALQGAQDVIERRVNAFGVGEPLIQSAKSGNEDQIIVELPGIKDIEEAKNRIKDTPFLEFKEEGAELDPQIQQMFDSQNVQTKIKAEDVLKRALGGEDFGALAKEFSQDPGSKENGGDLDFVKKGSFVAEFEKVLFEGNLQDEGINPALVETQFGWHIIKKIEERGEGDDREVHGAHILFAKMTADSIPEAKYKSTGLSGKNLESASVVFQSQGIGEPQVSLKFDDEGAKMFADITRRNLGKSVAIYLDGSIISAPTVQSEITNGEAVITGSFTIDEAKQLAGRLNEGALPVPLVLVGQESVEASLGEASLDQSLKAGMIGILAVMIFMIVYYRFLGLVASFSLLVYSGLMITIIKLSGLSSWSITLTLSGIAGFVLSVGMAVDANVLIFERTREELLAGRSVAGAIKEGFRRAWPSIKDGNSTTILTSIILYMFGSGFVKGFAITLILGVLISMFTAIVLVRIALTFLAGEWLEKRVWLIAKIKK